MVHRILFLAASFSVISAPTFISTPALAQSNTATLQEEIRKVRAYNAQETNSPFQDAKIKLLAEPTTEITYVSTPAQQVPVDVAPKPIATYTRIHRVVKDDTLYNLAKRNCIAVVDIQKHNAISNNNIQLGQALSLPNSKCVSKTSITAEPKPVATLASIKTQTEAVVVRQVMPIPTAIKVRASDAYAVLPKDSLYSIGKRYCVSASDLAKFNEIETATSIQPGQILRLPKNACK